MYQNMKNCTLKIGMKKIKYYFPAFIKYDLMIEVSLSGHTSYSPWEIFTWPGASNSLGLANKIGLGMCTV